MICCSVPKGPEEISGFPPRSSSEQKHCWDTADGVGIKVRGPHYSTGPKCRFKSNGFSFIMNFRLPDVQLVIIWSLAEGVDWLDTPQGLHFRRFVYEMSAEERSKRLKLIARVLEGSFMLKQAVGSKPAIIGNQCRIQYFQQQDGMREATRHNNWNMFDVCPCLGFIHEIGTCLLALRPLSDGPSRLDGGFTAQTICTMREVQILRGVGRTCLAPFYAVNFGDNMVGDVLTSLARPLRDVPAAMCYLGSHHPQLQSAMEQFVKSGNTCPAWEHEIISPLIAALPFWFRLWQCARRFWDTGHFSARVYCIAVVGDILLRCTWILTLMPITVLGEDVVFREILHVFMTVAEIFRRSFWAILRIEYEQVANAILAGDGLLCRPLLASVDEALEKYGESLVRQCGYVYQFHLKDGGERGNFTLDLKNGHQLASQVLVDVMQRIERTKRNDVPKAVPQSDESTKMWRFGAVLCFLVIVVLAICIVNPWEIHRSAGGPREMEILAHMSQGNLWKLNNGIVKKMNTFTMKAFKTLFPMKKAVDVIPSDVFLVGSLGTGTTWLSHIMHGLRSGGSMSFEDQKHFGGS
eukprot:g13660.t1